jgi:UDP-glucose:(heptosyl)LPS alpha-1,3-glucosyltransferase
MLHSGGTTNHARVRRFARDCRRLMEDGRFDTAICFSRVAGTPFHFCGDPCFRERFSRTKPALARLLPRYRFLLENERKLFASPSTTHLFFLASSEIPPFQAHYEIPDGRVTLLPPWLRPPESIPESRAQLRRAISDEFGLPDDAVFLLFVGSDFPRKGLDLAIRALASDSSTNTHLLVCGRDRAAPFRDLAERCSLGSRLHFLGPRDDVPRLMSAADILLHPARQETAGMVLLEALTYGLPVLCTSNCGYATHTVEAGCLALPASPQPDTIAARVAGTMERREEIAGKIRSWAGDPARYRTADLILETIARSLTAPGSPGAIPPAGAR